MYKRQVVEDGDQVILIDGQQRTTTLYLLLYCLGRENISGNRNIELDYSIRKNSQNFLNNLKKEEFDYQSEDPQNQTESKKTGSRLHGWKDGRYCVMEEKRCYTVKELQEILGISRPTVYELLKRNEFRWIQIGTKYRISKKSFDEWLDRKMENP